MTRLGAVEGVGPAVEVVDARARGDLLVEPHRPLGLEEALRVGLVGAEVGPGDVQAEVVEGARHGAGAAAAGAGDQDERAQRRPPARLLAVGCTSAESRVASALLGLARRGARRPWRRFAQHGWRRRESLGVQRRRTHRQGVEPRGCPGSSSSAARPAPRTCASARAWRRAGSAASSQPGSRRRSPASMKSSTGCGVASGPGSSRRPRGSRTRPRSYASRPSGRGSARALAATRGDAFGHEGDVDPAGDGRWPRGRCRSRPARRDLGGVAQHDHRARLPAELLRDADPQPAEPHRAGGP